MVEHLKIIEKTQNLSQTLIDVSAIEKIYDIKNNGQKIQMCVSATIIFDVLGAFDEYCALVKNPDYLKKQKVSVSLLSRYIYESYVTFLYIFVSQTRQTRVRAKAFYHYGEYKKEKIRGSDNFCSEEGEWIKYINQKSKKGQWHGKTFQDLCNETNYSPIVYQVLSQFTHPGIFTLERTVGTKMFEGIMLDSLIFTSSAVCDLIDHAYKLKLLGIKQSSSNKKLLETMVRFHNETLDAYSKKGATENYEN